MGLKTKLFVTIYLIALHIGLLLAWLAANYPDHYRWRYLYFNSELTETQRYRSLHGFYKQQARQISAGDYVFLGDSLVQAWNLTRFPALNLGIGGDTLAGLTGRISEYQNLDKARLVLLIGINDLLHGNELREFNADLNALSSVLGQNSSLVWLALLPNNVVAMKRIKAANKLIEAACQSLAGCSYIDLSASITGLDGQIIEHYFQGDGLHMNAKAYRILSKELKKALALSVERS